ncbi:DUF1963 domain-containing protein [Arenimonas terrae]|uniref:DUF1963 domain-containing protein n=2 Tax=Arenimonas terrae TaxID=2546226 RepID=A0A5C4RV80_9GAMM|nr:DUF1963 domain-containing protein [Arenimonas terrae]
MKSMLWILPIVLALLAGFWLLARAMPHANAKPTTEPVTAAHVDAFLAPHRATFEASRRPVHHLSLEPFADDEPTASKVGGRAWWPQDEPAPTGSKGQPLVLLAQINFAELPPTPGYPDRGLLQFFITANDFYGANFDGQLGEDELTRQRDFRVVYWRDTERPSQRLPLVTGDYLPHRPEQPLRMGFEPGREGLSAVDDRFQAAWPGGLYAAAEAHAARQGLSADDLVSAVHDRFDGSGHKVGGYPHFTQEDPRRDGGFELLLQLDTDDRMMWGDSGVGGFFIRPDDLARADFSRVLYSWDCY